MTNVILQLVLKYFFEWLSGVTGAIDWAGFQTSALGVVNGTIEKLIPVQWVDQMIEKVVDAGVVSLVAGLKAALADQDDQAKLIAACAAKDWVGALVELEAILAKAEAAAVGGIDVVQALGVVRQLKVG